MDSYLAMFLYGAVFLVVLGYPYIRFLNYFQYGTQPIREDGPSAHKQKAGTPTMGGLLLVLPLLLYLSTMSIKSGLTLGVVFVFLGYAAIGLADDLKKVLRKDAYGGMTPRQKLVFQVLIAFVGVWLVHINTPDSFQNVIFLPVLNWTVPVWFGYFPLAIFVVVGASNAVNLTDGLDGLVTLPVLISLSVFLLALLWIKPGLVVELSSFQIEELSAVITLVVGACLGFLVFNLKPAKIFMGDVGSLSLGGFLGILSVALKLELILAITGFVFVMETISVMIQIAWFRKTGKRFFKMAPIHHHFEQLGWSEVAVVKLFWFVSFLTSYFAMLVMAIGGRL